MKVLVTGGAGYIGSVVVEQLLKRGDKVVVVDNLVQGHREALPRAVKVEEGDLRPRAVIDNIMHYYKPDAVIHLAALVAVGDSMTNPARYFDANALGTLNVLEAMRSAGVLNLVFASSAAVYEDMTMTATEESTVKPSSIYGLTKAWGEQMIEAYCKACGMNATCFRFFNVAGATEAHGEDHDPEMHLFPNVIKAALDGKPVQIFGSDYDTPDGSAIRDFIHVSDIARAHILALGTLDGFKLYNLGSGAGFSCLNVVNAVAQASGQDILVERRPRRHGDNNGVILANWLKAFREMGWQPEYGLQNMADSAWRWVVAHPGGYHD